MLKTKSAGCSAIWYLSSIAKLSRIMRGSRASTPRFAAAVHRDGAAGSAGYLDAMVLPAEVVADIPVLGLNGALHGFATAHVAELRVAAAAIHIGADGAAGDRSAHGGNVVAAPAADLVAKHAAQDGAD